MRNQNSVYQKYCVALSVLLAGAVIKVQAQTINSLASYTVENPREAKVSEAFSLSVVLKVEPGWYIYAPTGVNAEQGMIETDLVFTLPDGINRAGKLKLPETHFKSGYEVLEGKHIALTQPLRATHPGQYQIKARLTYQMCSISRCLPPVTEDLVAVVSIKQSNNH